MNRTISTPVDNDVFVESFLSVKEKLEQQDKNQNEFYQYQNYNLYPKPKTFNQRLEYIENKAPDKIYKTKSLFGVQKPSQTEYDQVPIDIEKLNRTFGYTNYDFYKYQTINLPKKTFVNEALLTKYDLFD